MDFRFLFLRNFRFFPPIFCQMNLRFEIKDTGFVEVLDHKLPNAKKKRNVLASKLRREIFQNFQKKKSKTIAPTKKKNSGIKTFSAAFYIYVPNFKALGPIIYFFKTDLVSLRIKNFKCE